MAVFNYSGPVVETGQTDGDRTRHQDRQTTAEQSYRFRRILGKVGGRHTGMEAERSTSRTAGSTKARRS